jgi:hypothetical protein
MITTDELLLDIVNSTTPSVEDLISARDSRVLRSGYSLLCVYDPASEADEAKGRRCRILFFSLLKQCVRDEQQSVTKKLHISQ